MKYEIEIEELEDFLSLLEEDADKMFFVGQVNAFSETHVTKLIEISHNTVYSDRTIIVRYLEKISTDRLPVADGDIAAEKAIIESENKVQDRKMELVKLLQKLGFQAYRGTWKICE